jgi:hypothetical protein
MMTGFGSGLCVGRGFKTILGNFGVGAVGGGAVGGGASAAVSAGFGGSGAAFLLKTPVLGSAPFGNAPRGAIFSTTPWRINPAS